ncbi:MAG: LysR family transcriptional regulator [Verrucomicrobia bacterium]|nr:LysR family transcriptional regulator [Verrucomicrobiota bacterium]
MDLADLNIFATIARYGSITKAAERLNTVQSNVTTRLRLLEEDLGVSLFQRHHHGVSLTRFGRDLLPFAHQVDALMQKARQTVSGNQKVPGQLRLGSLETTAAARLPSLLRAFVPQHRAVDLAIETGTTRGLIQAVLEYHLDGAFVAGPVDHDDLDQTLGFAEELVLATSPECKSITAALGEGGIPKVFVFRVGCSYRQRLEAYLGLRGLSLINQLEMGTLEGIIGCVSAGLGVTMLPLSVIQSYANRGEIAVHRLPADEGRVETVFITRRGSVHSPALAEFIRVLREHAEPVKISRQARPSRNGLGRGGR